MKDAIIMKNEHEYLEFKLCPPSCPSIGRALTMLRQHNRYDLASADTK